MSPVQVLRAAREKISDPKRWTQGNFAHDEVGDPVSPTSPFASCWCAIGALDAVAPTVGAGRALKFLRNAVIEKTAEPSVSDFNDRYEHADVLNLFDRAIELAEGQP